MWSTFADVLFVMVPVILNRDGSTIDLRVSGVMGLLCWKTFFLRASQRSFNTISLSGLVLDMFEKRVNSLWKKW